MVVIGTVQITTTDMDELLEIAKSRVTHQLTAEKSRGVVFRISDNVRYDYLSDASGRLGLSNEIYSSDSDFAIWVIRISRVWIS